MTTVGPRIPSERESGLYYYGLPSIPILVARSSTNPWVDPTGPEAFLRHKVLTPVGPHALENHWESTLIDQLSACLRENNVAWITMDPYRSGYTDEVQPHPVVILISVAPGSLSAEDGLKVVTDCRALLTNLGLNDVHAEIRESEASFAAKMKKPAPYEDSTAEVQEPFATSVGIAICGEGTPNIEGTGGFFFVDPDRPHKLHLLTARHVLFNPRDVPNTEFLHSDTSQSRRFVCLLGDQAFHAQIASMKKGVATYKMRIDALKWTLATDGDNEGTEAEIRFLEIRVRTLEAFLKDISREWSGSRVIGHVVASPPLGLTIGPHYGHHLTEDWAIIEVDQTVVNNTNFVGNAIDLGTTIEGNSFNEIMHPHHTNPPSFRFPADRLLKFAGRISLKEMISPGFKDHDGEEAIMVVKRGAASGLAIGQLNSLRSARRYYTEDIQGETEKYRWLGGNPRWLTRSLNLGDSGSSVLDAKGNIAGMLTGGVGNSDAFDVSYVTPIDFLLDRMKQYGYIANIFPTPDDL